jgi:hypothetical protein
MADLSNLLGDVYGDPDGPPVRHEGSAGERVASGALDDDLAAALSAALAAAPGVARRPAPEAPAIPPRPADEATPAIPDLEAFVAASPFIRPATTPAAGATPALRSFAELATEPEAPVPHPQPLSLQSSTRISWELGYDDGLGEGDDPFSIPGPFQEAPDAEADVQARRVWQRHDDDILPMTTKRRRFRR